MQPPKSYSVGGQRSSQAAYRQARTYPARLQRKLVRGVDEMDHTERFKGIPMSKAMRAMCKEEDYAFLRSLDERRQVLSDEIQQVQKELEERHKERQFLTQLRRTEGSVGVLRSHDRANFLFCTQELESYRPALQVSALSSLDAWPDFQRQVLEEELGLSSGENSKKVEDLLLRI
ncbi:UNVERIFIED_CONTAM: hypothetical protein FKN15_056217 [Acipenser sinensis]